MLRTLVVSSILVALCCAGPANADARGKPRTGTQSSGSAEGAPKQNKWNRDQGSNDYATALRLSPQAIQVLSAAPTEALPDYAPNDAVMIYLAKQQPEDVRQKEVAKATATALIMTSDRICETYMADFLKKSRGYSSGLRVGSLAFSTAAGVSTPVRSANVLSAVSSLMSGSEEKLTETVLGKKAPELIYRSVMSVRTKERTRLLTLLSSPDLDNPTASIVISQIADYHNQCGPTVGINGFEEAVQANADLAASQGKQKAADFVAKINVQNQTQGQQQGTGSTQ